MGLLALHAHRNVPVVPGPPDGLQPALLALALLGLVALVLGAVLIIKGMKNSPVSSSPEGALQHSQLQDS